MHPQIFLCALVAPLALSLPQPINQAESGALIARQESGNSTSEGNHRYHGAKLWPNPPGAHHSERALKEGEGARNWTEAGHSRGHDYHDPPPHKERDLVERQESGNSTGEGGFHKFEPHHGPGHHERDLIERQEPGNFTGGGDHEPHHHKFGHPGPKVDKRIEEANGTTPGHGKDKFVPDDGYHGGPQRPGEHKRSFIDMILNRN